MSVYKKLVLKIIIFLTTFIILTSTFISHRKIGLVACRSGSEYANPSL
jgi:uncharacterized membrane protein